MRRLNFILVGATGAALCGAGAAQASDYTVTLGGRAQAVIPYEGAGHNVIVPVPVIQIRREGDPDRPSFPGDALGLGILHVGGLSIGPSIRARQKRNDHGERAGLREVNLALEPGAFVTLWPTDWIRFHADGGKGVRGHRGWAGEGGADVVVRPGRWMVSLGPRIGYGDRKYMDAYFGVTPSEAAANVLIDTAYSPTAGRRYVGGVATLAYHITPRIQTTANFSYHKLSDKAADSPIVQLIGDKDEFSGGLGLKYSFGVSR